MSQRKKARFKGHCPTSVGGQRDD